MYLLIDRERLCVLYKHSSMNVLSNLMHIELPHHAGILIGLEPDNANFGSLSDYELKLMHESLCGQKFQGFDNPLLVRTVHALLMALPESEIDAAEAEAQAQCISMEDLGNYKYVRGSKVPSKQQDLYKGQALTTAPNPKLLLPPTPAKITQPASATQAAAVFPGIAQPVPKPAPRPAPDPSIPRPASVPSEAPKAGSKTGRVWEIAESIFQAAADKSDWKALRKQIVEACEAEEINSSTAGVQYGKWKQTKI